MIESFIALTSGILLLGIFWFVSDPRSANDRFQYFFEFLFAIWAKLIMGSNWGPPAQHTISRQSILVTSGPFSFSRNPIYLGLLIGMTGYFLTFGSLLILLIAVRFAYLQYIV